MAELRIGTCSWKYASWKGLVYSGDKGSNYLEEYAQTFNTVEIDQWFWSLHGVNKVSMPRTEVVESYVRSVSDDFKFSVKVPNSITLTHYYQKNKNDPFLPNPHFLSADLFNKFLVCIDPMKEKLGPLMFQFEYLNKMKMTSLDTFIHRFKDFIEACPSEFTYCVEIRNPNYLKPSYFDFLDEFGLSPVLLHGYYMPPIWDVYSQNEDRIRKTIVLRLHGPDRKGIEENSGGRWDRILVPRDDELDRFTAIVQRMNIRKLNVWLNVNNHFEGSAPLTIKMLRERLA